MMQLYVALLMTCISEMLRRLASTDLRVEILVPIQAQLKSAKSIQEVITVVRSYGFRLRSTDFIVRKHEWRDDFFPWAGFSTNNIRQFMHSIDPGVDDQG
jgi:hypothetical protein